MKNVKIINKIIIINIIIKMPNNLFKQHETSMLALDLHFNFKRFVRALLVRRRRTAVIIIFAWFAKQGNVIL